MLFTCGCSDSIEVRTKRAQKILRKNEERIQAELKDYQETVKLAYGERVLSLALTKTQMGTEPTMVQAFGVNRVEILSGDPAFPDRRLDPYKLRGDLRIMMSDKTVEEGKGIDPGGATERRVLQLFVDYYFNNSDFGPPTVRYEYYIPEKKQIADAQLKKEQAPQLFKILTLTDNP